MMQNNKTNQEQAKEHLARIAKTTQSITTLREQVSLIEYGLIKDVIKDNPNADMHTKTNSAQSESEQKEINSYLSHVVALPMGYKSIAGGVSVSKTQESIYASTKHLQDGKRVSDGMVEVIAKSEADFLEIADKLTERLDNYGKENYEKGMVNPAEIQANIDAGKPAFKKTSHLILNYGFDPEKGGMRAFAVERTMGIQGEYASHSKPTSNPSFSAVVGNPMTANDVIIVTGDHHNMTADKKSEQPYKVKTITDDFEAATYAHANNINQKNFGNKQTAVVVTDVRSLKNVFEMVKERNPEANTSIYTDSQGSDLHFTTKFGEKATIPSAATHAVHLIKDEIRSEESAKKHRIMIKTSEASLSDQLESLRDFAKESAPDSEYQQTQMFNKLQELTLQDFEEKGLEVTSQILAAYKGVNPNNTVDSEAQFNRESRMNHKLNAIETDRAQPAQQSIEGLPRETIAPDTQQAPRLTAGMR